MWTRVARDVPRGDRETRRQGDKVWCRLTPRSSAATIVYRRAVEASVDYSIIQYPALPHAYASLSPGRRIDMIILHSTAGIKAGDLFTLSGRDRRHLVSCH